MNDYKTLNDMGIERSWEELYEDNVMLQQENKQLKEKLDCDLQWAFKYEKQVDNWNKLKEYIEQEISIPIGGREFCCYSNVRDKIKELERGVSDEN